MEVLELACALFDNPHATDIGTDPISTEARREILLKLARAGRNLKLGCGIARSSSIEYSLGLAGFTDSALLLRQIDG